MQNSTKVLRRRIPRTNTINTKQITCKPLTTSSTMAFFPRNIYGGADASFTPLFRLLDDFDTYSRQGTNGNRQQRSAIAFQPKFDVREIEDAYELHGELAGVDKKDISIEFSDPHTLLIRGRVDRTYTSGTPPAGLLQDEGISGAITENGEKKDTSRPGSPKSYQATVEDAEGTEATSTAAPTPTSTVAEVKKPQSPTKKHDGAKYWVTERSIGEFSRTFNFPGHIQQDAVTANLKDGILTLRVPKARKEDTRRRVDIL